MAAKYPVHAPASQNWSANWCDGDDGVQDVVKPGAADIPTFTPNSGNVTMDENSAALGGFTMTAYSGTLAMGAWDINVDGDCTIAGAFSASAGAILSVSGSLSVASGSTIPDTMGILLDGTGNVPCTGVSLGLLTVNTAGTHTVITSKLFAKTLTIAGAGTTFNGATLGADIAGNIIWSAGAWTNTGTVTQTDNGNVSLADFTNVVTKLVLGAAGKTSTLTGTVYCKAFQYGAGTVALAARVLQIRNPATGDYWTDGAGSITSTTGKVVFYQSGSLTQSTPVTIGAPLDVTPTPGTVHTFSGGINISGYDLTVGPFETSANPAGVAMGGGRLVCRDILEGISATRFGSMDFGGGIHSIRSFQSNGGAASNVCNFASAFINLSGTIDGTGIVVSNTAATIIGGTVQNCDLTGATPLLHLWPVAVGAGNTLVLEAGPEQVRGGNVYVYE